VVSRKLLFDLFHHPLLLTIVYSPLVVTVCSSCTCITTVILVSKPRYLLLYLLRQPLLLHSPAIPIILGLRTQFPKIKKPNMKISKGILCKYIYI